jgi:DNA (cytosine-5)-methyltransferase 1
MRYLSLFSGIEACSVAWKPLGWTPVAFAEVEPFPCAVLAHHYPGVPNLGDVTAITNEQIAALGPIDLVVGGSPCQDLSVAGKRAGLSGERSSLFNEQIRIFHAARSFCGARWLVWENVPGAFSSNSGVDFAIVVGAMAGCFIHIPGDGWGSEGVALGQNGLVEWAVLDAQWFGLAQRRRRVFAVLDTGAWADRQPVLLEPDSLRGDHPPRREAGEGVAPTLSARAQGGGGLGTDFDCDGGLIAGAVTSKWAKGAGGPAGDECQNLIAHTLRADGFDASEDGTGRGTPLVPVSFPANLSGTQHASTENLSPALCAKNPTAVAYAFQPRIARNGRGDTGDVVNALTAEAGETGKGDAAPCVATGDLVVRRITPTEASRLQGFPDNYTAIPWRGKPASQCPDGPRYKALGNSMAVTVMRWIGQQIQAAVAAGHKEAA